MAKMAPGKKSPKSKKQSSSRSKVRKVAGKRASGPRKRKTVRGRKR
jgi:hypothetical protein